MIVIEICQLCLEFGRLCQCLCECCKECRCNSCGSCQLCSSCHNKSFCKCLFYGTVLIIIGLSVFGVIFATQWLLEVKNLDPSAIDCSKNCLGYHTAFNQKCCTDNTQSTCLSKQSCIGQQQTISITLIVILAILAILFIIFLIYEIRKEFLQGRAQTKQSNPSQQNPFLSQQSRVNKHLLGSKDSINKINSSDTCKKCLASLSQGKAVKLQCSHVYHKQCIMQILKTNYNCPICQSLIRFT